MNKKNLPEKGEGEKKLKENLGYNTQLTQAAYDPLSFYGFVNPPIVHASTVVFPNAEAMESGEWPYTYGTRGTPTTKSLCHFIDNLEGSTGTILLPSGLAAVTVTFLSYLSPGDHALIVDSVYANVRHFCDTVLKRFNIDVTYYRPNIGREIEGLFQGNTKLIHTESPGSNTFEIQDIPAISNVAHKHGIIVTVDNTWATPIFFKPLEHGADVSIQASTKYPGGHADILMGTVSANERHWKQLLETNGAFGFCGSADDSYMLLRGLRTMGVRLERHFQSALRIAEWLEQHEAVERVLYPALPSFPDYELWKRDFSGASGVFSFVLKCKDARDYTKKARLFLNKLSLFKKGYSWGAFNSLALLVNLDDRKITKRPEGGPLIRLQVGLEDVCDLIGDIENALRYVKTKNL